MTSAGRRYRKKIHFCTEQAPGGSRDESDALFTHFSIRGNCWYLVDLACQSIKSQQRKSRGAAGWWWEWSLSCSSFVERMMAEKTVWSFGDACCELARGSTVFLLHVTEIFLSWRKRQQQLIGKASTRARVQGNRTGLRTGLAHRQMWSGCWHSWTSELHHQFVPMFVTPFLSLQFSGL